MSKRYVSLASKIVMILIVSSISAVLVYSCFREQISHYYSFVDDIAGIKDLMDQHDQYTSMWLYEYRSGDYIEGSFASILEEPSAGTLANLATPLRIS